MASASLFPSTARGDGRGARRLPLNAATTPHNAARARIPTVMRCDLDGRDRLFGQPIPPHRMQTAKAADMLAGFPAERSIRQVTLKPPARYPGWVRMTLPLGVSLVGWWLILALLE